MNWLQTSQQEPFRLGWQRQCVWHGSLELATAVKALQVKCTSACWLLAKGLQGSTANSGWSCPVVVLDIDVGWGHAQKVVDYWESAAAVCVPGAKLPT